ncbi:cuticle protein 7-like isoform X1 [Leptopilina heterotoma]|uniref:cuticle protein 7-like isoform X1 n=2 Tax=Leptopilina heterotoma TaxID=63436 RepID=UPI001CA7DC05|nr:cuticle protein 7-like isoform X1 [Leptopilina heterotoma]
MASKFVSILMVLAIHLIYVKADGHARSFQHFEGPVHGEDHEVTWVDKHGHKHQDYEANPHYEFAYGVEDHHTGDYHGQKEHRNGKQVTGEYTLKEPNGNIRTVKYVADHDGFHAEVINSHDEK